ncbi:nck-associated protein 5-like [Mastacembelus armatus]|uniref:nck-associated protein 5-like n=1 Tax=Mastacembelus armatus TaxID=205130 RepID=UPI000E45BD5E|nr:nck-associated protein 5-like [Mastacembelus armatus]
MVTLQQHFSSMEETVRTLLQNQDTLEGPKVDPLDLMKAYKDKLLEEMWKQQDSLEGSGATAAEMPMLPEASGGLEENSQDSNPLLERLRALEAENSALSMENDNQRKQYERCLDEVANQVVQALLTQKDLKEECVKLRTRVFDLEQQNRILSVLFQQRVKMSTTPVSQEVQRNGKASIPAGRWPSLLSLTCPRSSGSGSELSLSSACSEHSSGSHTWAEGRGFSKQCATSRDKRMSTGSVCSSYSAPIEQADLGWKECHILKGLKRLQMHSSKEASSLASVPHCKDCMTSNEGIYSFGIKCGLQGSTVKQVASTSKLFKAETGITALDYDDADVDSTNLERKESSDQPSKELFCLKKLEVTSNDGNFQKDPIKLAGNYGLFPSPVTDNFLFLEGPTIKPGISPTDTLMHQEEKNKDTLGIKFHDRNNNQEKSSDRKSRLDHVKRQQGGFAIKQVEAGSSDVSSSIPQTAARAFSFINEVRQRSSSVEVTHCRNQASQAGGETQDYTMSESQKRKPKPQPCDSARKAFILRSRSADGGPEQAKHTHSPLHQKLIRGHRSKGELTHTGHSVPSKRTNLSKTQGTGAFSKVEKDEDIVVSTSSKSLESVQQHSPLTSPVKHSKAFKSPAVNECVTKSALQITKPQSSTDPVEKSIYDNLPCSPRKQRRQDQHSDVSCLESRSPSPAPPPGRTTSLRLRAGCDALSKAAGQTQSSATEKPTSSIAKPQSDQLFVALHPQQSNTNNDNHITAAQMGVEEKPMKDNPAKVNHAQSAKIPPVTMEESQTSDSVQLPMDKTCHDNAYSILPGQSILQRSQQSISEPKLSEVLPQVYSNVYYHGIASNSQSSTSRTVKMSLPVNAKSQEAINGQDTSNFLIFGRQNKDDTNPTASNFQTFQTLICDPQMIHDCSAHEKTHRKIETRCNSLDSEPSIQPVAAGSAVKLDWGFDEEGWLFKRSVSVSTRPVLTPIMGMNGAKARSQSFGARYMDRPSFNRSAKVRTQIKTHSGSSLNSLGDVLPGSISCSSSYYCPVNRSLLNNFLIEEGLTVPSHLGSSSERLQSLKLQREQARRLQIEQQFSSAFGEPVSEEPETQSTITTIEEKVMLGIEENLHKSQEQERNSEVKQKSGSALANWFGFRKSKLPAPNGKKMVLPKVKEEKKEQKFTSLLGGKQTKSDKKRERRKSDGKDCSMGRREPHDAVRACISMPCPGMSLNDIQGHTDITGEPKCSVALTRGEKFKQFVTDVRGLQKSSLTS